MRNYSSYFLKASESCNAFGLLTKRYSFSEKEDSVELYAITSLHLCKQHSKAISILLENKLYVDVMLILRNIMELSFNLHWIGTGININDKIEKVFQLEGTAFSALDKEIKMMLDDANSNKLVWRMEMFQDKIDTLNKIKETYPHLLTKNKRDENVFKEAPHFAKRMDELYKLKFYNIYRFLSTFVHPSPILREFTLLRSDSKKTPLQILENIFPELIEDVLFFICGILEDADKILSIKILDKKKEFEKITYNYFNMVNGISNKY